MRDAYLLLYNTTQLLLWSACLLSLIVTQIRTGDHCTVFGSCVRWARYGQLLSSLEVVHASLGLAGGAASTAFVQQLGRNAVLFGVLAYVQLLPCTSAVVLLGAWALADIVRYLFYIDGSRFVLIWLRYTLFIVLYPVGIGAELSIYLKTMAEIEATNLHALVLPNPWNFAFNFATWNRGVLLSYVYFAPLLFSYMLNQRRRKLGPPRPSRDE